MNDLLLLFLLLPRLSSLCLLAPLPQHLLALHTLLLVGSASPLLLSGLRNRDRGCLRAHGRGDSQPAESRGVQESVLVQETPGQGALDAVLGAVVAGFPCAAKHCGCKSQVGSGKEWGLGRVGSASSAMEVL